MRKSVFTGVFACALVFIVNSNNASAIEVKVEENNNSTSSIIKLENITETPKSPLLTMAEASVESIVQPEQPVMPVVIIHTVAPNESLSMIAARYQTTWERIYNKNTNISDPDILSVGTQIIIPEVSEQLVDRPMPVETAPVTVQKTGAKTAKSETKTSSVPAAKKSTGNGYIAGYCTWYVKNKRPDMPNNLGNASTWVSRAAAQGMATGSTPTVGAVGQKGNHVVYVEAVNGDGTVTISEMNHKGRWVMTTRTLPASYFSYIY